MKLMPIFLSLVLSGCAIIDDIRGVDSQTGSPFSDIEFDRERRFVRKARPASKPSNLGSNYIVPDPAINTARRSQYQDQSRNNYYKPRPRNFERLAIETRDIYLGMTAQAVKASWGEPKGVESAGDPSYGYQRWKYELYIPSAEGYVKEHRMVYFEKNKVVGWETK